MRQAKPPLFIPLKSGPYNKFKHRIKTHEIRLNSKRWNRRTCFPGRKVVLSHGYGKHDRMSGKIVSVEVFPARELYPDELADFVDCFGEDREDEKVIYIGIELDD